MHAQPLSLSLSISSHCRDLVGDSLSPLPPPASPAHFPEAWKVRVQPNKSSSATRNLSSLRARPSFQSPRWSTGPNPQLPTPLTWTPPRTTGPLTPTSPTTTTTTPSTTTPRSSSSALEFLSRISSSSTRFDFLDLVSISVPSRSISAQDDESLRRWKEQLLGSVDLSAVGGAIDLHFLKPFHHLILRGKKFRRHGRSRGDNSEPHDRESRSSRHRASVSSRRELQGLRLHAQGREPLPPSPFLYRLQ